MMRQAGLLSIPPYSSLDLGWNKDIKKVKVVEIATHQKVYISAGPEVVYGIVEYSFSSWTDGKKWTIWTITIISCPRQANALKDESQIETGTIHRAER